MKKTRCLKGRNIGFPNRGGGGAQECPVEGCRGRAVTRTAMRIHFLHRHVRKTGIILEEGNLPHPRCPRCDMLVPWNSLKGRHVTIAQCAKGVEQKILRLVAEEMRESMVRSFQAYGRPLETVTSFKYLGRIMTASDNDWLAVVGNTRKNRKSWVCLTRILRREGAIPRVSGMFFKAVVQAVLLFGSETWVMTPCMGRTLGGVQHRVARRITGRQPKRQVGGSWEYPPLEAAMQEAGFEEMGEYVLKRQNTVAQYIVTRPILDLCEETVRMPGTWVAKRWWEQEGLDLARARAAAAVAEGEGERGEEETER